MKNPSLEERLAPSRNNHLLTLEAVATTALTRSGKEVSTRSSWKFNRFRAGLAYLQNVDFASLNDSFGSWEEIQEKSIDIFADHIDESAADIPSGPRGNVEHASIAGIGTVGAFLRTIPEVDGTDIDRIAIVRHSVRTMMRWATLSQESESDLSMLVSDPKPNLRLPPRTYNVGLKYNPRFFTLTKDPNNDNQWVDIDTEYIESLGKKTVKSIDHHIHGTDIYFGCPFRMGIPKLYNAMSRAAFNSGLL